MDISVVVPLFNEEESIPELFAWIERVMKANGFSYEVIFVNDGSTDRSWEIIEELQKQSSTVKGIKFRRNYGKSPALYCGFERAEGNVVFQAINRKDTTRCRKLYLPNYLMPRHVKFQGFIICTTLIAD